MTERDDSASRGGDTRDAVPAPTSAHGTVRPIAVAVAVAVAVLGLLSVTAELSGWFATGPAADAWGPVSEAAEPEGLGRQLDLSFREVAPVLGAWVSARVVDEGVMVEVGSSKGVWPDGTLVHPTVSETVPVGGRLSIQAWADITVDGRAIPNGPVTLSVEPAPVDADNPDGSVVAGFEPGTTRYDGVEITVGTCLGERTVALRVTRDDVVLVEKVGATAGDAWDVPQWRRLTVLGVDNAYAEDGCRVVVELAA